VYRNGRVSRRKIAGSFCLQASESVRCGLASAGRNLSELDGDRRQVQAKYFLFPCNTFSDLGIGYRKARLEGAEQPNPPGRKHDGRGLC
jgi:hypothetical protein